MSALTLGTDTAGKHATIKVPLASAKMTMKEIQDILFKHAKEFESINYIYIVSDKGRLHGVLSIKDIFRNSPETQIRSVMKTDLIKIHPHTDQEKAAHLALTSGIKAVPLVDEGGHFLGVVSNDKIQSILESETKEDFLRFAGIVGKHTINTQDISAVKLFSRRIPWILIGLLGGLLTAKVIGSFEHILAKNILLAGFIPLIAYIANAVGVQTQTVYIRDLVTQQKFSTLNYLMKQIITSILIGTTCWLFIFVLAFLIWHNPFFGLVIGLAVLCAILVATFFALLIPYILKILGTDPAIGSGPFSTIIQDLLSIIIYFLIASALL